MSQSLYQNRSQSKLSRQHAKTLAVGTHATVSRRVEGLGEIFRAYLTRVVYQSLTAEVQYILRY